MGGGTKTYEDKHSFGIAFPTVCHLFVLFVGQIEIHSEKGSRTIGKVVLSRLGFRPGCGSIWREAMVICSRYSKHEGDEAAADELIFDVRCAYLDRPGIQIQDRNYWHLEVEAETSKEMVSGISGEKRAGESLHGFFN